MCISPGGAEYQMYSGGGGGIGIASTQNFGVWTGNGPGLKNVTFSIGALLDAGTFFKTQTSYKNVSASQYAKAYPDLASAILGNSAGMGQAGYVLAVEDLVIDQAAMDAANSGGDWLKQYVAIVAGESGNSHDEAQGIGEVIQRRMAAKGTGFCAQRPPGQPCAVNRQ